MAMPWMPLIPAFVYETETKTRRGKTTNLKKKQSAFKHSNYFLYQDFIHRKKLKIFIFRQTGLKPVNQYPNTNN